MTLEQFRTLKVGDRVMLLDIHFRPTGEIYTVHTVRPRSGCILIDIPARKTLCNIGNPARVKLVGDGSTEQ
jgi:hypothetical protein